MRFRDQLYGTTSKMRRVSCFDLHELGDMKYRPLSRFELIVHIPIELPPLVPRGLDALRMGLYHELYCSTTMWPYLLFMYKLRDPIPKNTMNCECQWQAVAGGRTRRQTTTYKTRLGASETRLMCIITAHDCFFLIQLEHAPLMLICVLLENNIACIVL